MKRGQGPGRGKGCVLWNLNKPVSVNCLPMSHLCLEISHSIVKQIVLSRHWQSGARGEGAEEGPGRGDKAKLSHRETTLEGVQTGLGWMHEGHLTLGRMLRVSHPPQFLE